MDGLTGGTSGVDGVIVTNGGLGYANSFAVTFTGGGGTGAAGTATAIGGTIVSVEITNHGSGYTTAPTPVFTAGGGTGAAGTAVLTAQRLDAIPTVNLPVGLVVFFVLADAVQFYVLAAGTDAESSPDVIRPDDYAAGTNEKVWKLASTLGGGGGGGGGTWGSITGTLANQTDLQTALDAKADTAPTPPLLATETQCHSRSGQRSALVASPAHNSWSHRPNSPTRRDDSDSCRSNPSPPPSGFLGTSSDWSPSPTDTLLGSLRTSPSKAPG